MIGTGIQSRAPGAVVARMLFWTSWGPLAIVVGIVVQTLAHWKTGLVIYLAGVLLCSASWNLVRFLHRRLPVRSVGVIAVKPIWWFNPHPDWRTETALRNIALALCYRPFRVRTADGATHVLLAQRVCSAMERLTGRAIAPVPMDVEVRALWPGMMMEG